MPGGDRIIVFGGFTSGSALGTGVFQLSLSGTPTWSKIVAGGEPPSRWQHSATYDPVRNRILVVGGAGSPGGTVFNDAWALSLSSPPQWIRLAPVGTPPLERYGHTTIYDPVGDRIILFGGFNGYEGKARKDTWALNLGGVPSWTLVLAGEPSLPGRLGHSAAYDPVHHRMLIYGGWEWDQPEPSTWALSLNSTPEWAPVAGPPRWRSGHSAIYDPFRHRMLIFGGRVDPSNPPLSDTWAFNLDDLRWELLLPSGQPPPPRADHSAIYDPVRDRMIVFGGANSDSSVWALSLSGIPSWSQISFSGVEHPQGRNDHAAVYDPVRDRMLIFGGMIPYETHVCVYPQVQAQYLHDMWALDLSGTPTWAFLGYATSQFEGHSAIYEPDSDRVIAFGGHATEVYSCGPDCCTSATTFANLLQALPAVDNSEWQTLVPANTPPTPRSESSIIYDPFRKRVVAFGGFDQNGSLNETWAIDLAPNLDWHELSPAGNAPGPSAGHAAIYDPNSDAMWVYSAAGAGTIANLSWARPTPIFVSLLSTEVTWELVRLKWALAGQGTTVSLFRNIGRGWTFQDHLTSDDKGFIAYEDRNVAPSTQYGYRLGIQDGDQMVFGGETWLSTNEVTGLALEEVQPNPVDRELSLTFLLPNTQPATIEVVDVTGRAVLRRDVGFLGSGRHTITLHEVAGYPAGVYFVRLRRNGQSVTAKTIIIH